MNHLSGLDCSGRYVNESCIIHKVYSTCIHVKGT